MKLPVLFAVTISCLATVSPALANGPGMMEPAPTNSTAPTNTTQNDPQCQRWIRHRLEQLEKNHEHYQNEKVRAGLLATPIGGQPGDYTQSQKIQHLQTADVRPFRKRHAIRVENGTRTPNQALPSFAKAAARQAANGSDTLRESMVLGYQ